MNVINLVSGESHGFTLIESSDSFSQKLSDLTGGDGGNLRFEMDTDDRTLFESRFEGEHIAVFMNEFRQFLGVDDSLTYREDEDDDLHVITTYRKPD